MSFAELIKQSLRLLPLCVAFYVLLAGYSTYGVNAFLFSVVLFFVCLITKMISLSRIPLARRSMADRRTFGEEFSRNFLRILFILGLAALLMEQSEIAGKLRLLSDSSTNTLIAQFADSSTFLFFWILSYICFGTVGIFNDYDYNFSEKEIRKIIRQEQEIQENEHSPNP